MRYQNVDKKIRERFGLFCGKRPLEEDEKIYGKIYEGIVGEFYRFIEENLDPSRASFLIRQIEMIKTGIKDEERKRQLTFDTIFEYLLAIPEYRLRLTKRLEHYINNLLINAINKNIN